MKLKYMAVTTAILIACAAAIFAAFNTSETRTMTDTDGIAYTIAGKEDVITKAWTLDTLTTTEKDTLTLGFTLASPYQYCYQLWVKKISGTPSLKVVLDQRNSLTNTDWLGCDSLTISGADSTRTFFALKGANVWGLQHRLRLVGTSGTNRYRITGLLKKTAL
jgi:hypothetical protein